MLTIIWILLEIYQCCSFSLVLYEANHIAENYVPKNFQITIKARSSTECILKCKIKSMTAVFQNQQKCFCTDYSSEPLVHKQSVESSLQWIYTNHNSYSEKGTLLNNYLLLSNSYIVYSFYCIDIKRENGNEDQHFFV